MYFFYLIEQHSKFLSHTLQVLYMCTLCDSANINTIIEFIPHVSGDGFSGGSDSYLQFWDTMCMYVCVCVYIYIYIYIERERERAPVRYVTKTSSVVLLNKKYIFSYLKCIVYDKLLKPRQSFQITLHYS